MVVTLGVILVCSSFRPKLLVRDLQAESKKVEDALGIKHTKLGVSAALQPISVRAYTIPPNGQVAGKTIAEAERSVSGARLFVERIRRSGEIFSPVSTTVLEAGDTVAVLGRTEALINLLGPSSIEATDPELLDIPVASFGLYVTSDRFAGKTLRAINENTDEARGVLIRRITRGEQSIPIGPGTVVQRGDTLEVSGPSGIVERLAPLVGRMIHPTEDTDFIVLGTAIFLGVLFGAVVTIPLGHLRITLVPRVILRWPSGIVTTAPNKTPRNIAVPILLSSEQQYFSAFCLVPSSRYRWAI